MLKLQDLIQQSRLKANLKTIKENPPIRSPPSNRSVENAIQWIRGVSNTLLHYLRERTGWSFGATDALAAWSWHHAVWLLNRYSSRHGQTGYAMLTGHSYKGKVAVFGEPILAYTFIEGMPKGNAPWTRGLFTGFVHREFSWPYSTDQIHP